MEKVNKCDQNNAMTLWEITAIRTQTPNRYLNKHAGASETPSY